MEKITELKGLISELVDGNKVREAAEIKKEERMVALENATTEQKDFIEKLKASPVKGQIIVPGTNDKIDVLYKGYDLSKQSLVLGIADEDKKERYAKYMINVTKALRGDMECKTAMAEGAGANGGYLVPEEWANEVIAFASLDSFALRDCNVVPMKRDKMNIPAESTKPAVAWKDEAIAAGEVEPTFATVALDTEKLTAYAITSNELLEDEDYDLVSILTRQFAEDIGQELDNQVLNGTTFTSILSGAGNTVTTSTTAVSLASISLDDILESIYEVPASRTKNAKFYMHRLMWLELLKKKDDESAYIFGSPGVGIGNSLYGYPVFLSEEAPYTSLSAGDPVIVFGDMKYYVIGKRKGDMSLDLDPYGLFLQNQTRFRTVTRWDGQPGLAAAFTAIQLYS